MDAFFAAVEQRDHPELAGKPVAVGGSGKRGVVASASYEARVFGVRSAMPGSMASRLCPGLIFVRPRFEAYKEVSLQIRAIFLEYTDLVEPLSLDEAYLDVTHNKAGMASAIAIAREIRQKIFQTTGLTGSAGISYNKFLAKMASDLNKPNGQAVILPEEATAFLEKLPVDKFHGIGRVTAQKMHRMGIHTGADLKAIARTDMWRFFGKSGEYYYHIVRGEDNRLVNPRRIRKSIGAERTFSDDISDTGELKDRAQIIAEGLFQSLTARDLYGRTITLKLKTAGFQIHTRSRTFPQEVRSLELLCETVFELIDQHAPAVGPVRLLGITVSNLTGEEQAGEGIQLAFW